MEITLEDVRIAIKVLEEFEKRYRESLRVLKKLGITSQSYTSLGLTPESIIRFLLEQTKLAKAEEKVEAKEEEKEELTPEELEKLRKIKEKIKMAVK
ncbi:MAG: hypothetical protein QXY09_05975 [Acidilobaceae archaeon]